MIWGDSRKQGYSLGKSLSENRGNSVIGNLNNFYLEAKEWSEVKVLTDKEEVVAQVCQEKRIAILQFIRNIYVWSFR